MLSLKQHGGTRILVEIANLLSDRYSVSIIIPEGAHKSTYQVRSIVQIVEIPSFFKGYLNQFFFILKLIFLMRKYDLIIVGLWVFLYPTICAKIFSKLPYLYVVQDIESKFYKSNFLNFLALLTYKSNKVVPCNEYLKIELKKMRVKIYSSFNIGITDQFLNELQNNNQRAFDLLYFPRKDRNKNLSLMLDFLKSIKFNLKIALVSQDKEIFKHFSSDDFKRHSITYITPLSEEELIKVYDNSKVFLSTSLHEGFSLPPLEAMSRGCLVILYPSGGPELYALNNFNCIFYENIHELLISYQDVYLNYEGYSQYINEGIKTSGKYRLYENLRKFILIVKGEMGD